MYPSGKYEGFEYLDAKVDVVTKPIVKGDLAREAPDNCTIYEVFSNDLNKAFSIGIDVKVPLVTTLVAMGQMAKDLGLSLILVEDDFVLAEVEEDTTVTS